MQLRACTSAAHAEQAVAPEVKLDPEANVEQAEVESGPEIKQEPFTIRGHFGLDRIRRTARSRRSLLKRNKRPIATRSAVLRLMSQRESIIRYFRHLGRAIV